MSQTDSLPQSATLAEVKKGELILHTYSASPGTNLTIGLNTLFRQAHPLLVNRSRYQEHELVVPGPIVLASTLASSARGFFEILYDEIEACRFLLQVHPRDSIGAVSYATNVKNMAGGLEELSIVTLGLREIDVLMTLRDVDFPLELFELAKNTKNFHALIAAKCPVLKDKVALQVVRKIVRQKNIFGHSRNVPLL